MSIAVTSHTPLFGSATQFSLRVTHLSVISEKSRNRTSRIALPRDTQENLIEMEFDKKHGIYMFKRILKTRNACQEITLISGKDGNRYSNIYIYFMDSMGCDKLSYRER